MAENGLPRHESIRHNRLLPDRFKAVIPCRRTDDPLNLPTIAPASCSSVMANSRPTGMSHGSVADGARCIWPRIPAGDLEAQIGAFVDHYNHHRYHESLGNLTPADVYFGRDQTILLERERIKRETINLRRLLHRRAAA